MIGEIRKFRTQFYDIANHRQSFKVRPGLIIAAADSEDYVVLPVSKISDVRRRDPEYDVPIVPAQYPKLNLSSAFVSYVRTHKQTVIHVAQIGDKISDAKEEYEDLYLNILEKRAKFSEEITKQALGEI